MGNVATVLVIDDDSMVRRVFRRMLEHRGISTIEAEDGPTGLLRFREQAPSAVLLDLRMPGMDGLEVLSALVEESPETPVLVVSGEGTMTDVVEALRRGAWDFVSKPMVDPELLISAVWRSIEKQALMRQNREYSESLRDINVKLSHALDELRRDQQAARHLQFQLLPEDGLRIQNYTCYRRLFPSQLLSGDFVDYFALGPAHLGFYVADVAGHGAASAFVTAILTALVGKYREALTSRGDETILHPDQFLARLDADLSSHRLEKHVTMFFGVLEIRTGHLVYSSAGAFPYPLLATQDEVLELECSGRPLNLPGRGHPRRLETELRPGGRLLAATDGILEIHQAGSQLAKRQAISKALSEAHTMPELLHALSLDSAPPLKDDIALLFLYRSAENHD